jgi:hypothetical protein
MQSESEVSANQDSHQEELPAEKTTVRPIDFYTVYCSDFPWAFECKIFEL